MTIAQEPREVTSDDLDIDEVGGYRLSIFMGGNGDWYVTILKPGDRLGPCVRLAMSGGASSKFPGLGVAIADVYRALGPRRLGDPGVRDPDFPCTDFQPGPTLALADCETDGHYLCSECGLKRVADTLAQEKKR